MAKKRAKLPGTIARAVTPERAARVYRLLRLLSTGAQDRSRLTKQLRLDVRGFYRDLELLRAAGVEVALREGRYLLKGRMADAVACLPIPDPHLTLGEAQQLANGRTPAHQRLRKLLASITR